MNYTDEGPLSVKNLPRAQRKKVESIINSMPKEDREAWDEMAAEDEDLLVRCLTCELTLGGGVFTLDGIKKHFQISRAFLAGTPFEHQEGRRRS